VLAEHGAILEVARTGRPIGSSGGRRQRARTTPWYRSPNVRSSHRVKAAASWRSPLGRQRHSCRATRRTAR
jgi:hypothetical protein